MNFRTALFLTASILAPLCFSCSKSTPETALSTFISPQKLGLIDDKLHEASGIAASVVNPGYIWVTNDSGNPAEVYLIDTTGHVKMTCKLPVDNRDWEEIAIGPGPDPAKTYVYVGEIGDNNAIKEEKIIYRFEEPTLTEGEMNVTLTDTLTFRLPDGKRDTETMMIDPLSKDLYIVSKREDSVRVYVVTHPFSKETMNAEKVVTIPYQKIVAGAFSPDGTEILLKEYDHIYYWRRSKDDKLEVILADKPEELPYEKEAQGESITWAIDGSGYYTLSETNPGKPAYLKFYKRR